MLSPLHEKRLPSCDENASVSLRERIRISVLPKVPAARMTLSAKIVSGCVSRFCSDGSVCTTDSAQVRPGPPPAASTRRSDSTDAPV